MPTDFVEFATMQQRRYEALLPAEDRRQRGHFGTPPAIARFMARMFVALPQGCVRILDPGAGVGILTAALCERLLAERAPRRVYLEAWENEPTVIPLLRETLARCREGLQEAGHDVQVAVRVNDFILANSQKSLFEPGPSPSFHLAILNPPYFKVRKEAVHAQAMPHVVHGQPNIYALFLAATADLLLDGGQMVAITPRSYFNGPYFRRFRKWFFDRLCARQIHVFESRSEAFKDDAVLQENVILCAEKAKPPAEVLLTTSRGPELQRVERQLAAYDTVIDNSDGDHIVRVASNRLEEAVVEAMDRLPQRFRDTGLEVSTGPVVTFRATELLRAERGPDTAPLLWMHNVRPFATHIRHREGKPAHILVSEASRKLLVPASTYLLLKRFTSKEERRRLVAGIMKPSDSYSDWVGLENHLNYIYRRSGRLRNAEALGLAAFFNSALVDRYFRAVSGNTQVNAAEVRALPVPDHQLLLAIGESIELAGTTDAATVERIVAGKLRIPQRLTRDLVGAAP